MAAVDVEKVKVQKILDSIAPARKDVVAGILTVEKMLRNLELELRKQCEDVLGQPRLEVPILPHGDGEAEDAACASAAGDEAKRRVPLHEDGQVMSMSALRRAQQRSSALLAQFVQLPQKLKVIFDLTKTLGIEVNGLVPMSVVQQAEARASRARLVEQRQSFHVELLQKRLQTLTWKVTELGGMVDAENEASKDEASEADTAAASREIQEELQRGITQEEQLLAARSKLRHVSREFSSRGERMKNLETEVVDLHLSRYNERAQCLALLQQSAGLQNAAGPWPWPPPVGGLPDFADEAWRPGGQGVAHTYAEWPAAATCAA
jgi:hypothetical protein